MFKPVQNILNLLLIGAIAAFTQLPLVAQTTHTGSSVAPKNNPADTSNVRYGVSKGKKTTATIAPVTSPQTQPAVPADDAKFDYGSSMDLNIPDADEDFNSDMPASTEQPSTEKTASPLSDKTDGQAGTPLQDYLKEQNKTAVSAPAAAQQNKLYETYNRDIIKENKLVHGPAAYASFDTDKIPEYSDEEYARRLKALPTVIPMNYNELVGKFIRMYVMLRRDQITRMLPRTDHFFRIFEDALDRYGLPMELKYLPVMESALIPHAKSESGAGLWQLPYGTAKMYGLEANSFIDERFDPVLSTEAAVQHLRNLYSKYHDWQTVIAAFNCGEGTVNKAIRQAGGRNHYWDIVSFLPDEAQSYVPLYIAAVYVMNYYPEHNLLKHDAAYNFYATDTVKVYIPIDLKEVANYIGMPLEELQFLNPAVKRNVIPRMSHGFPITLPVSKIDDFGSFMAGKSATRTEIIINNGNIEQRVKLPENSIWNYQMNEFGLQYTPVKIDDGKTTNIEYTVKDGDVLGTIAENYDCTTDDLKRWNRLTNSKLALGQVLIIKVPKAYENVYKNIEARNLPEETTATDQTPETQPQQASTSPDVVVAQYIFKEDDSLDRIAKSFNITKDRLMRFNNLKVDIVMPGTVLKIPAPVNK